MRPAAALVAHPATAAVARRAAVGCCSPSPRCCHCGTNNHDQRGSRFDHPGRCRSRLYIGECDSTVRLHHPKLSLASSDARDAHDVAAAARVRVKTSRESLRLPLLPVCVWYFMRGHPNGTPVTPIVEVPEFVYELSLPSRLISLYELAPERWPGPLALVAGAATRGTSRMFSSRSVSPHPSARHSSASPLPSECPFPS